MKNTPLKRAITTLGIFLLTAFIAYGFLALCNWSPYLKDWTGFSRFIMAAIGVIFLLRILDDINVI